LVWEDCHGCLNLIVLMRFILPKLVLQGSSEPPVRLLGLKPQSRLPWS
jgi:hypothetical protein